MSATIDVNVVYRMKDYKTEDMLTYCIIDATTYFTSGQMNVDDMVT